MNRKGYTALGLTLALSALTGCMVGPNYKTARRSRNAGL